MSISACPKCGGTSGYEGVLIMRYEMGGSWGELWGTTGDDNSVYKTKNVKCVDCGCRVDRYKAMNIKKENQ